MNSIVEIIGRTLCSVCIEAYSYHGVRQEGQLSIQLDLYMGVEDYKTISISCDGRSLDGISIKFEKKHGVDMAEYGRTDMVDVSMDRKFANYIGKSVLSVEVEEAAEPGVMHSIALRFDVGSIMIYNDFDELHVKAD